MLRAPVTIALLFSLALRADAMPLEMMKRLEQAQEAQQREAPPVVVRSDAQALNLAERLREGRKLRLSHAKSSDFH